MDPKQIIRDLVEWADARPRIRRMGDDPCWQRARAFLAEPEPKQPVSLADLRKNVREEIESEWCDGETLPDDDDAWEDFIHEIADSNVPVMNATLARLLADEPTELGFPEDMREACEGTDSVYGIISRIVFDHLRSEARQELSRLRRNREECIPCERPRARPWTVPATPSRQRRRTSPPRRTVASPPNMRWTAS